MATTVDGKRAAESALATGEVLAGTYEIVRLLGRGGMGAVYEARHLRLAGRRVAIKILLRGGETLDDDAAARFRREAEIGARLGHPNIVAVTDFDRLPDGSPFLVMEYLSGEDLAHRLAAGPLPRVDALRILSEVGSALAAAHKQGIVHRDLKPQNVFLVPVEDSGAIIDRAKVLDFGVSKMLDAPSLTSDSVLLGTPRFMAPEQARGNVHQIDARSDQFALATMAYEMLSGRRAFQGESLTAVLFQVVHEQPPPLTELPPALAKVIERAMAKDQAARFPDVTAFIRALTSDGVSELDTMPQTPAPGLPVPAKVASNAQLQRSVSGGASHDATAAGHASASAALLATDATAPAGSLPRAAVATPLDAGARPESTAPGSAPPGAALPSIASTTAPDQTSPDAAPPARRRLVFAVVGAVAIVAVAGALIGLGSRGPRTVHWKLRSAPAGALVLDAQGRVLGSTPLDTEQPNRPGSVDLVLRRDGYFDKKLSLDGAHDTERDVPLVPITDRNIQIVE